MINLFSLLKNKVVLAGGVVLLIVILSLGLWYYKSKSDINRQKLVIAEQERDKALTVLEEREKRSRAILEAVTNERDRAVSREALKNSKKQKLMLDAHANDNLPPDYAVFFDELWELNASNDN